jgi:hypothetical protein
MLQHAAYAGCTDPQHMLPLRVDTKYLQSGIGLGLDYFRQGSGPRRNLSHGALPYSNVSRHAWLTPNRGCKHELQAEVVIIGL